MLNNKNMFLSILLLAFTSAVFCMENTNSNNNPKPKKEYRVNNEPSNLICAIEHDDIEGIKLLIARGSGDWYLRMRTGRDAWKNSIKKVWPNFTSGYSYHFPSDFNPIIASVDRPEILKELLKSDTLRKLFINARVGEKTNVHSITPIELAIKNNYCESIKILIENGAYLNRKFIALAKTEEMKEILNIQKLYFDAIESGDYNKFKNYLLQFRIISTIKDQFGNTLLHKAISSNQPKIAALLISLKPELLNQRNNKGQTPVELAAGSQQDNVLKQLIFLGYSREELLKAIEDGNEKKCESLISKMDVSHEVYILKAIEKDNSDIVRLLLEASPKIITSEFWSYKFPKGDTYESLFDKAKDKPKAFEALLYSHPLHKKMVLLNKLAKLNSPNIYQVQKNKYSDLVFSTYKYEPVKKLSMQELIYNAVKNGQEEFLKELAENVNLSSLVDENGNTVLHAAIIANQPKIVKFILDYLVNLDLISKFLYQENKDGMTVLDLVKDKSSELIQLIANARFSLKQENKK